MNEMNHKAIKLLAAGFSGEFCDYLLSDEKVIDLLHEKVSDFIDERITFTNDQAKFDLAMLLLDKVYFTDK